MDSSTLNPPASSSWDHRLRHSRALVPALAAMLVAVTALATVLIVRHADGDAGASASTAPSSLLSSFSGSSNSLASTTPQDEVPGSLPPATPPVVTAPVQPRSSTTVARSPVPAPAPAYGSAPAPVARSAAPVCGHCGVVESVSTVAVAGQPSGVGAIAGGVLGGVLGNQVGKGSGRTAMTVLGAVGGGYAGNMVERNYKKTTAYSMHVRMDDGSRRTFQLAHAIPAGSRVVVENGSLRTAS